MVLEKFSDIAGKVCEFILPIRHDIFIGNPNSSIAVCTLSSIDLLLSISRSDLMQYIAIVGRLLSENKGIDALVRYVIGGKRIRYIIIAGKDSKGHLAGQSLLALWINGIDSNGRIIGSKGKDPTLTVSKDEVDEFRAQINTVIDMRDVIDVESIRKYVSTLIQ
ncbi:MAG: tetrahydromethanopterin S-methyltransferase subunit A [Candidatus Nitrosocaldus sp.]